MASRVIFHIDVNNAFLSWSAVKLINEGFNIDIRNIASVIGGDESNRHGIVLAKSQVAKKFGVVTAETLYSARKKCHDLKVYPPNYEYYMATSKKLFSYLSKYSPDIEQFSVDECYMDMTNTKYLYDDLVNKAYEIKDDIKSRFGFTVNIGIGNNKLCAKMASDFEKPNKVHTLFLNEIEDKLWILPVGELFMVGRKSSSKLNDIGIKTIGQLANTDINVLKKHFKSFATTMWEYANGIDESVVATEHDISKSISTSMTMPKDTDDLNILKNILLSQSNSVGVDLRKIKKYATVITVTFKTKSFKSYSRQMKIKNPTSLSSEIYKYAIKILEQIYLEEEVRNIGVRVSNLVDDRSEQLSLFDKPNVESTDKIQKTLDDINTKFGSMSVIPASLAANNMKNIRK